MNPRQARLNAALLVTVVAMSLAIGEIVLRQFVTTPLVRVEPEVRYRPDPVRRFSLLPSQTAFTYGARVTIDAGGFRRNGSVPAQPEREGPVVLALGDSFTFGLGVQDGETWPAQLEARLRAQTGREAIVVNAGTISYGVFQEMDLLRSAGLQLRPDVVVHGLYWNDFMNAAPAPEDAPQVLTSDGHFVWDHPADTRSTIRRLASWVSANSALIFSLRQVVVHLLVAEDHDAGTSAYAKSFSQMLESGLADVDWEPIEKFYSDLERLGRENSFETLVVIMPVHAIVCRPGADEHPYPAQARRRLEAMGLAYVDGFSLWTKQTCGTDRFLPEGPDGHLNAEGYRLIADAVAARLLAIPRMADRFKDHAGAAQ